MIRSCRSDTNPRWTPAFETSSRQSPEEGSHYLGHNLLVAGEVAYVKNIAGCGGLIMCPLCYTLVRTGALTRVKREHSRMLGTIKFDKCAPRRRRQFIFSFTSDSLGKIPETAFYLCLPGTWRFPVPGPHALIVPVEHSRTAFFACISPPHPEPFQTDTKASLPVDPYLRGRLSLAAVMVELVPLSLKLPIDSHSLLPRSRWLGHCSPVAVPQDSR